MKNESRIRNTIKNTLYGFSGQVLTIILNFILRTIFIYFLGMEYLGVNGLFANILSVLSLTELGLGTSITYSMYRPIAEKDNSHICILMTAFKKLYAFIGLIIFTLGLLIMPFLNHLIADSPNVGNLYILYFMFLVDTASTYFFGHYRALVSADQKEYINVKNRSKFKIIQVITQIIVLITTRNYYLYLFIQITCNILSNLNLSLIVKNKYIFLKDKPTKKLSRIEIKEIIKYSIGFFSHKMGYTVLNSTDNIIISTFIGSLIVGMYSNYLLLINTVLQLISIIINSVQASVGNLVVNTKNEVQKLMFFRINFIYFWIYGFCAVCLITLSTPFVKIWVGNEFIFNNEIVYIIILNFYITGARQSVGTFTGAKGLFWYLKYKPIFEVIINLIFSIVLIQKLGLIGVFIGTFIATISTSFWYEPYILFKKGFNSNLNEYFIKYLSYLIVTIISAGIINLISDKINIGGLVGLILNLIVCIIIYNIIFIISFFKTEEFKYIFSLAKSILRKWREKYV